MASQRFATLSLRASRGFAEREKGGGRVDVGVAAWCDAFVGVGVCLEVLVMREMGVSGVV